MRNYAMWKSVDNIERQKNTIISILKTNQLCNVMYILQFTQNYPFFDKHQ